MPRSDFELTSPRGKTWGKPKGYEMIPREKEIEITKKLQESDFIAFNRIKMIPYEHDELVKELEDIFEYYNANKKISEPTKGSLTEAAQMVLSGGLNYNLCLWHRSRMMLCDYRVLLFYAFDELQRSKVYEHINKICGTDDFETVFSIIIQDYTARHPEIVHVLKTISKIRAYFMVKDDLWDSGFIGF